MCDDLHEALSFLNLVPPVLANRLQAASVLVKASCIESTVKCSLGIRPCQ